MLVRKSILLSCLGAAALAACSPFDPELGVTPYLCGAQEPRCPDDYTCMDDGNGKSLCVQVGGTIPDAGPDTAPDFQCAEDGKLEPNNTTEEAFPIDVGTNVPMRVFGPIGICPEGDKDHFLINLVTPLKAIEVITRWDSGPPISCSILNEAGTPIANSTVMGQNAMRACAPNLPARPYYAVAYSPQSLKNNYRIEMKVVENCAR